MKNIYERLLEKFGPIHQKMKAIEELSELSRAIVKNYQCESNEKTRRNIEEEIADVHIMLEQLKLLYPKWIYEFNKKVSKLESIL